MPQPSNLRPTLFMLVSTFSLSLNGLMGKLLSESFATETLGFLRFFLPAAIMLGLLRISGWALPDKTSSRPIVIRALCVVGSQICFLIALRHLTLVESVVLFSTGPLFIPLLEKLLYKTPFHCLTLLNLCLTFTGVILQAGSPVGFSLRPELFIGIAAGLFNALSQVTLFQGAKSGIPPAALNGWCFMLAAIILLPFATFHTVSSGSTILPDSPYNLAATIAFLIILTLSIVSTQMFRSMAYRLAETGSQLAPLIFTNLIFALIWQLAFFDTDFGLDKILGLSLIVLANLSNTFIPRWQKRQAQRMA